MKKLLYLIIAAALLGSCSTEKKYTITGTIDGADSSLVFIQKRVAGQFVKIDSAMILDGKFEIAGGMVDYPDMVYFMIDGKRGAKTFFLENSKIEISGKADSLMAVTVTGSTTQDEYDMYVEEMKPVNDKMKALNDEYREVRTADPERAAAIDAETETLYEESVQMQKDYVKAHPASFATVSILKSISYGMDEVELEEYLNALDPKLAVAQTVIDLRERVAVLKTVAIGVVAPDFEQADAEGNMIKMSSLNTGKYLFIDFWASWCGPCRRENPNVVKAYEAFHPLGLEMLGVSLDRENEKDKWLEAIVMDQLGWNHVSDLQYWNNAAAKLYGVNSIPANILLDSDGVIIAKNLRGEKLHEKLAELLAQ